MTRKSEVVEIVEGPKLPKTSDVWNDLGGGGVRMGREASNIS